MCIGIGLMSYVYWFGLMLIGFLMIPVFDKNISSSFYAVLAANFIELDSCSNLSTLPHVILHEGLARSCRIHSLS